MGRGGGAVSSRSFDLLKSMIKIQNECVFYKKIWSITSSIVNRDFLGPALSFKDTEYVSSFQWK